ncbi:MAG TPA: hypothetical protein VF679_10845, partial [Pedobacter sp.]
MLLICVLYQGAFCRPIVSQSSDQEPLFTELTVKKKSGGRICDTCTVDFVHHADVYCSYVITGTGRTPWRLSRFRDSVRRSNPGAKTYNAEVHIISGADFSISFLPNVLKEKGKTIQLYGNSKGADYKQLEFLTTLNGKPTRQWTPINNLGEIKGFAILGLKRAADQASYSTWGQTFCAGSFHLAVKDTLVITVRNILTKEIVQTISF